MRVAADDLDKIVLAFDECLIIDAASIHLAKTIFTALRDETAAVACIFVVKLFLIFVANGGTIDNDTGPINGFFSFEARFHSHIDKLLPAVFVDAELGALAPQHMDFRAIGH